MSSQKLSHDTSSSPPIAPLDPRLPPSPPASPKLDSPSPQIARILKHIHALRAGRVSQQTQQQFHLLPEEFSLLNDRISASASLSIFHASKVRYTWSSASHLYTLCMPSATHEIFTSRVTDAIQSSILALAARLGGSAADALKGITKGGSPTLKLFGPAVPSSSSQSSLEETIVETHRSPDGTFFHEGAPEWPGVVLEVSYSQQGGKLGRIAEGYVVDSFGGIRCVIGLELPYKPGKSGDQRAAVSVWRPKVERDGDGEETLSCACDVEGATFVGTKGEKIDGELGLGMKDLLPPDVLGTLAAAVRDEKISIPFSDLAAFLEDASKAEEALEKTKAKATKPGMKRKKRKRTPEEEMDEEREGKFLRLEEADIKREQEEDCAWKGSRPGSSSRAPERRSARLSLRSAGAKAEPS